MNEKQIQAYLVLSVSEIKQLLKAAWASQKQARWTGTKDAHCIVLKNLNVKQVRGKYQICSSDVSREACQILRAANA